jgi:catechol 2,3-dioxygenase-like lactoylglutathione lyase family enzyme
MEPVQRLSHVGLTVGDLDASLAFWRDHVGLRELGRGVVEWEHLDRIIGLDGTQIEWAELELPGGAILELFVYWRPRAAPLPPGGMNRPGMAHICLEVDHIEQVVERLTAAGYHARSRELVTIPRGAYKDFKCIYFLDPDGVTLELSERPAGLRLARRRRLSAVKANRTSHIDQEAGHHG